MLVTCHRCGRNVSGKFSSIEFNMSFNCLAIEGAFFQWEFLLWHVSGSHTHDVYIVCLHKGILKMTKRKKAVNFHSMLVSQLSCLFRMPIIWKNFINFLFTGQHQTVLTTLTKRSNGKYNDNWTKNLLNQKASPTSQWNCCCFGIRIPNITHFFDGLKQHQINHLATVE